VILFEDSIDLGRYPLRSATLSRENDGLVLGWVGNSVVGFRYLVQLREPLLALFSKYTNLIFRVVSGKDFRFHDGGVPVDNVRWSMQWEASGTFDIGLAPLLDTPYDQAKASYKILQYWSYGIPVVCSQSADNFLEDGVNCLIAKEPDSWVDKLSLLIDQPDLRKKLGMNGRRLVETRFALSKKGPLFASLLKRIATNSSEVEYFEVKTDED
jgi:glycosyltransferase involved in cell wall biosynthesis